MIFPIYVTADYEDYSYGTETRSLEPLRGRGGEYLAELRDDGLYSFEFEHKIYDGFGSTRRYIMEEDDVELLDDSSPESAHVEGQIITSAKLDPISGRPLSAMTSKTFVPTTLYVHTSDVKVL